MLCGWDVGLIEYILSVGCYLSSGKKQAYPGQPKAGAVREWKKAPEEGIPDEWRPVVKPASRERRTTGAGVQDPVEEHDISHPTDDGPGTLIDVRTVAWHCIARAWHLNLIN